MKQKHLVSERDWSRADIEEVFALARKMKADPGAYRRALEGRSLAMIFQKPSTRTRVSFEVGMAQLGGSALFLGASDIHLGRGETVVDTARAGAVRVWLGRDGLQLDERRVSRPRLWDAARRRHGTAGLCYPPES